jgi:hypothetical protein
MNITQLRIGRNGIVLLTALLASPVLLPLGCTKSETPQEWAVASKNLLPPDAKLMAQGTGKLSTVAPEDGFFYVADMTAKRKVTVVTVVRGDTITLSPAEGTISTSKISPTGVKLDPTHRHEIYFSAHPQNVWNQTSKETKEKVTTEQEQQHPQQKPQ